MRMRRSEHPLDLFLHITVILTFSCVCLDANATPIHQLRSSNSHFSTPTHSHHFHKSASHQYDEAWSKYVELVYGGGTGAHAVPNEDIHVIYERTPVHVEIETTRKTHPRATTKYKTVFSPTGEYDFNTTHFTEDFGWVEVTREPMPYPEGYSAGYPNYPNSSHPHFREGAKVPYGCWFFRSSGSGIFVNVGRSLRAHARSFLFQSFNLTCEGTDCSLSNDKFLCYEALQRGYDSIQMDTHFPLYWAYPEGDKLTNAEVLLCSGQCATLPLVGACPPVELRTGLNATRPCPCLDSISVLNCGTPIGIEYVEHLQRRKTCHMLSPVLRSDQFEVTILFTQFRGVSDDDYEEFMKQLSHSIHVRNDSTLVLMDSGFLGYHAKGNQPALKRLHGQMKGNGYTPLLLERRGGLGKFQLNKSDAVLASPSKLITVSNDTKTKLGIIIVKANTNVKSLVVKKIIEDESLCLRTKGASVVVLIGWDYSSPLTVDTVGQLYDHVDVILDLLEVDNGSSGGGQQYSTKDVEYNANRTSPKSCIHKWHKERPVLVQESRMEYLREDISISEIRIIGKSDNLLAMSSRVLHSAAEVQNSCGHTRRMSGE